MSGKKKSVMQRNEDCALDMTPMIDVVFQLIIFFVVTLKASEAINEEIRLEDGKNGPKIEQKDNVPPLVVELAQNGRISISNATMTKGQLRSILINRVQRMGTNFPLLIRADKRVEHSKVREVMEVCTGVGVWKLSFVAVIQAAENK